MRKKKWTREDLKKAAQKARSIRQVLAKLSLKEAGGNYSQIKKYLAFYRIDTSHFKGRAWNKGLKMPFSPKLSLKEILVKNSDFQSHKLKRRLFKEGLKKEKCELCGWHKNAPEGRIPLELDHINGNGRDNRLKNLRILCPNCHSLQSTHRGLNSKKK
jgi:hypothetical protein